MRAISRILLSLFAPWSGFLTASISSLPGATKSGGEPLTLGADLNKAPNESDPDEMARYFNDSAANALRKGDVEEAKRLFEKASNAGANSQAIKEILKKNSDKF